MISEELFSDKIAYDKVLIERNDGKAEVVIQGIPEGAVEEDWLFCIKLPEGYEYEINKNLEKISDIVHIYIKPKKKEKD